jgi:hypothetical protein
MNDDEENKPVAQDSRVRPSDQVYEERGTSPAPGDPLTPPQECAAGSLGSVSEPQTTSMYMNEELHRCLEQIRLLTDENQDLRRASTCFADLAERLNRQLCAERRMRSDRRYGHRHSSDVSIVR